jgi:two-component system chemotaxis response regulator CheY
LKIFIVDDEEMIRNLFIRMLEPKGIEVIAVSNGKSALDKITKECDLVFLDWLLPEISGLEVLEQIRTTNSFHDLPIIMVTALSEMDNVMDAMAAGANDYIIKPFSPHIIYEKIEKFTGKSISK